MLLTVEPPDYYPIVDKLFATQLTEALEALGVHLDSIEVRVIPEERTLHLVFKLGVSDVEGFVPVDINEIVYGVLDRLTADATSTFGRLYSVRFEVDGFRIIRKSSKKPLDEKVKLIVNGPDEKLEQLNRVARGLVITLREWGVRFSALTLSMPVNGPRVLKIVLKTEEKLPKPDKEALIGKIRAKARSFLKTLLGGIYPVEIKILDPEDVTMAKIMKRDESIERLIEELSQDEDIQRLLSILGKNPSGP